MKIITNKKDCLTAIKSAAKVAAGKTTLPVLSHLAFDFDGEKVTVTANDLTCTYSESFPAKGEPGQCTLEAKKLLQMVSSASADIEIGECYAKSGRSRIKLDSMSYADFPQPDYSEGETVGIDAFGMAVAIQKVMYAMPTKDARPMLNGVHFCDGFAVATDGFRMSWSECEYKGPSIIIPCDTVRQILDMTGTVRVSDRQMIIDGDGYRFTTRLVDAKYPDWRRVQPKTFSGEVRFNQADAVSAIGIAKLGSENAKFTFDGTECVIESDGATSAFNCTGDAGETAFNLVFLEDAIKKSDSEVVISIGDSRSASQIGCNVIMPVRI